MIFLGRKSGFIRQSPPIKRSFLLSISALNGRLFMYCSRISDLVRLFKDMLADSVLESVETSYVFFSHVVPGFKPVEKRRYTTDRCRII